MNLKQGRVTVSISEGNSPDTEIWLFRIMERIVIDQLNINPIIKGELLYSNQQQIMSFLKEFKEGDD